MDNWILNNMSLNCVILFISRFLFRGKYYSATLYHQLFESAAVELCIWRDSKKLQAAFHSPLRPSFMQLLALQGTSQVAQW